MAWGEKERKRMNRTTKIKTGEKNETSTFYLEKDSSPQFLPFANSKTHYFSLFKYNRSLDIQRPTRVRPSQAAEFRPTSLIKPKSANLKILFSVKSGKCILLDLKH